MRDGLTRRAATLALMIAAVGAGTPTVTHSHVLAAAAERQGAEESPAEHGHDRGRRHGDAAHRHAAVVGLFDVEIPTPADRPADGDGEPFSLIDEAPPVAAAHCPAPNAAGLPAVVLPEPQNVLRIGVTDGPPAAGSGGGPGGAVLRL
ncbi:hypothetical protein [Alienimonas sp. DA493]|uniref:hypothetical protein n=1 Tax=Alienimonas sp. DA493 TaxID=3373605 RepID=UPI003754BE3E